jgi:cytidylate kinase
MDPVAVVRELEGRAPVFFTVCVSRETGARGRTIGNIVARRLGWTMYDQELLEYIAREDAARSQVLAGLGEQERGWIAEWLDAILSPSIRNEQYIRQLAQVVLAVAMGGKAVFVGRGASFIVPRSRCVSVRLIGNPEVRMMYLCQRQRMAPEQAREYLVKTDAQRHEFVRRYFAQDANDPHHYDLILDSGELGEELCGELVVRAVEGKRLYLEQRRTRPVRPSPVPETY